jgi:Zn-dependent M16 (insulinase) family peptidase
LAPDALDAVHNAVEFRLRETYTGGWLEGQRGFALLLRALATWTNGGDPLALLAFDAPLAAVKRWAGNPRYFSELIRSHLLENPHRATLYAEPDPGFHQREEAAERAQLAQARAAMSASELQALIERTHALKQPQETPERERAALPTLGRADLDRESPRIPLELSEEAQTRLLYHPLRTNGIVYLDLGFDLRALSPDELPYALVFGRALLELGTRTHDAVEIGRRIGRFTGGIRPQLLARPGYGGAPDPAWLFLRGRATVDKARELLAILREVLLTVDLDQPERLLQLVLQEQARREAAMHGTLSRRLRAHFSDAGWADDQLTGLGSLFFLRQLAEEVRTDWPAVRARLEAVRAALVNRNAMLVNLTLDPAVWPRLRSSLGEFLTDLPIAAVTRSSWTRPPLAANEGFIIPSQVNYVGKGAKLFELGYRLHGSALAITQYLNSTWIWNKVRRQGGAYGGYAAFDHLSGLFFYASYHDPQVLATLDAFDGTSGFLRRLELDGGELSKSIIGAMRKLDAYQLPDAQGFTSLARYLAGETDEQRQRLRDELLATTPAHFKAFAEVLDGVRREGRVVILATEERLQAANDRRGGWLSLARAL